MSRQGCELSPQGYELRPIKGVLLHGANASGCLDLKGDWGVIASAGSGRDTEHSLLLQSGGHSESEQRTTRSSRYDSLVIILQAPVSFLSAEKTPIAFMARNLRRHLRLGRADTLAPTHISGVCRKDIWTLIIAGAPLRNEPHSVSLADGLL